MKYKFLLLIFVVSIIFLVKYNKNFFFGDFKINDIEIAGCNILTRDAINRLISEDIMSQNNLLFLDIDKIFNDLKSMPLIETARIKKNLPNTLDISIKERTPIALVVNDGKNYLFDKSGNIVAFDKNSIKNDNFLKELFYIEGSNILSEVKFISSIFIDKSFSKRISGVYKIGDRRWDMMVDKKIKVMLPEKMTGEDVISIFNTIDRMKTRHNIKPQAVYSILDARIKDKIFIKNIE